MVHTRLLGDFRGLNFMKIRVANFKKIHVTFDRASDIGRPSKAL